MDVSELLRSSMTSFEPKVSKLPSARNKCVPSTFLTAESFSICFESNIIYIILIFLALLVLAYRDKPYQ